MSECVPSALVRKPNKTEEDNLPSSRFPRTPCYLLLRRSLSTHELPVSSVVGQ